MIPHTSHETLLAQVATDTARRDRARARLCGWAITYHTPQGEKRMMIPRSEAASESDVVRVLYLEHGIRFEEIQQIRQTEATL